MKTIVLILISATTFAADVQWNRMRGIVKALDFKSQRITIETGEGFLMTIEATPSVHITEGKDPTDKALKDVHLDDKVTLTLIPAADKPKDETFEEMNGARQPK